MAEVEGEKLHREIKGKLGKRIQEIGNIVSPLSYTFLLLLLNVYLALTVNCFSFFALPHHTLATDSDDVARSLSLSGRTGARACDAVIASFPGRNLNKLCFT